MIVKFVATITILVSYCSAREIRRFERLPNATKPISYNLHFVTDVHKGGHNLNGTAQIRIQVLEDTDRIVLHGLNFFNIKLTLVELENGTEITNLKYEFDSMTEQMIITAEPITLKLEAGKEYLLSISYSAKPCARSRGFCLHYYEDEEDKNKIIPLAATHLSRGYARRVFPSYDEPALKANFTISVTHGNNYTALSNMPQQGESIPGDDGYVTTQFLESPLMSTYIVVVTVSNYENITEKVGNTDVRLFFKPKSKGGRVALEIAKKALLLMNDYFNISFPLPKIDHFSVPQMASRGMENWGLITYDERVLLNDQTNSESHPFHLQTVTHEMAHMWFGNLVTPAWWSQIWLSEGISTYYGYKFINKIKPEWNLSLDSRYLWIDEDACSLTCNAESVWEYESIFGPLPYVKGEFLLSMFENLLTEEVIRKGMIKYLEKHQYMSTTEDDLFDCLADSMDASSNPYFKEKASLKRAMKSWSTQAFYPFVKVTRNYENDTFTLEQKAFKTLREGTGEMWWIPIKFITSTSLDFNNDKADFIFPDEKQIRINPVDLGKPLESNDWLILNKQRLGLYRVNYDERNWNLIICALSENPNIMPVTTKIQMIKDLYELFIEGYVELHVLFNFFTYLENENSPGSWYAALNVLSQIFENIKYFEDQPMENLKVFAADIISNASEIYNADEEYEKFKLSSENDFLFELACDVGIEKCNRIINIIFEKINSSKKVTEIEEHLFLYGSCHVYKNSTKELKNFIEDYMKTQDYSTANQFFSCTKNKDQLKNLLVRTLNESTTVLEKEEITSYAMKEPESLEVLIDLLQEDDSELKSLFLSNVELAIFYAETREHKNMLMNTWKNMGFSFEKDHNIGINKKFGRHIKIRERFHQWLTHDPIITNVSC